MARRTMIELRTSEDRDAVEIVARGQVVATVRTGIVDGEVQIEVAGAKRAAYYAIVELPEGT